MRPRFRLEAEGAAALEAELKLRGIPAYHTHDSRRSTSDGFPDYVIPLGRWLMFAELKCTAAGGSLTVAQADWLLRLRGPWRSCLAVEVEEIAALMLAIDNTKAGRLDDLGPTGFRSVMVLGDVRRWYLLGDGAAGEVVHRAASLAAGSPATRPPRPMPCRTRRPRGS